jgi:hypothetical protein
VATNLPALVLPSVYALSPIVRTPRRFLEGEKQGETLLTQAATLLMTRKRASGGRTDGVHHTVWKTWVTQGNGLTRRVVCPGHLWRRVLV